MLAERRWVGDRWVERATLAAGVLAVLLVVTRYHHTYFFYDEWSMVDRVTSGRSHLGAAFRSFNGHLWVFPYFVYLAQVRWFGLVSHWPVFTVFCASLVALDAALVGLLAALDVPLPLAAAAAAVLTYFGPGSQSMVFEVQMSWNFATAFGLLAAIIVLRSRPGWLPATAAAGCLVVAAGWDGVGAEIALVFVAIVAMLTWRRFSALLIVAPAGALVGAWWFVAARHDPRTSPASAWAGATFAARLTSSGLGGLVARGPLAGVVAAVAVAAVLLLHAGRIRSRAWTALAAGTAATGVAVALITWSRAGLVKSDLRDYNRYIQLVAIFLAIAVLPALVAAARTGRRARDRRRAVVAFLAIAVVFILNLGTMRSYRATFELWNMQTRHLVAESTSALAAGCPPGTGLHPAGLPLGSLGPQVSVSLLQRLRAQWVELPATEAVDPAVWKATCGGPP